ncbi:CAP domain-containing protein [Anoxybacter fermentans]|uniref:CAP domain-containing protein n=1 Tax=Anoxybacter fermentans TaxID=1323375 RepID=UPI000F8CDB89|nr:CAP domain-containing protein [Anoxybacter fermentans]
MLRKVLIVAVVAAVLIGSLPLEWAEAYTWRSGSYYSGFTNYSYFKNYYYSVIRNYHYSRSTIYRKSYSETSSSELKYGSVGTKVKEVQQYLRELGYDLRTENGRFGYYTLKAVLDFKRKNGLLANGRVDDKTFRALKEAANKKDVSTQPSVQKRSTPTNSTVSTVGDIQGLTADERQMLNLINNERTKRGLAPLKVDMELVRLARMKSKDMIDNHYFSHISPTYGSPFEMMKNAGIVYRTAGENLAGASSVIRAHTNLMNSSGHRANILNPAFTHIGIGIVDGGPYGKMFTQLFIGR